MQGADGTDDDLSTLMPKSVRGLNASESTENELQALREYLDLQKQKVQQGETAAAAPQEVFLPAYNRRRDKQPSALPAGRPIGDENAPPLELLPPASKQRKTEREKRKQKGKASGASRRPFGQDLKQFPRKADESESHWVEQGEERTAAGKERHTEKQHLTDGKCKAVGLKAGRGAWVAARRKSSSHVGSPVFKEKEKGAVQTTGVKSETEKTSKRRDDTAALPAESAGRAKEQPAGLEGLVWPGSVSLQEGHEREHLMDSSEGTMMDMEIDELDEEVEGPMKGAEETAGAPPDASTWTFNPLFNGPDVTEVHRCDLLPQVTAMLHSAQATTGVPPSPSHVDPTEDAAPNPDQILPPNSQMIHSGPKTAGEASPSKSQAESNILRGVSAGQSGEKSLSLDTSGKETRAAAALANMSLDGGPETAAPATPQEEETDFPALEGSPPPVGGVDTSEDDEKHGQELLALAVAQRPLVRQAEGPGPSRSFRGKKNKRLMLLHGRRSLAEAGLRTEHGVRRTTRARVRPLEYWRNETVVYERSHDTLPTIARVVTLSPDPDWPRPEGRIAFRLRKQKLKELSQAEELLSLPMT